jgi:hypothetical protein
MSMRPITGLRSPELQQTRLGIAPCWIVHNIVQKKKPALDFCMDCGILRLTLKLYRTEASLRHRINQSSDQAVPEASAQW